MMEGLVIDTIVSLVIKSENNTNPGELETHNTLKALFSYLAAF